MFRISTYAMSLLLLIGLLLTPASAEVMFENLHLVPKLCRTHGIFMGMSFVVIFPAGVLLVRLLRSSRTTWIHASCQLVGLIMTLIGFGLGIRLGRILDLLYKNTHTALGTVIVVLLLIQPLFGILHHKGFRKEQTRTIWSKVHVWYGRTLIVLGVIDGGLGLQLANNTDAGKVVYGVLAGVMGICVVSVVLFKSWSTKQKSGEGHEITMSHQEQSKPV